MKFNTLIAACLVLCMSFSFDTIAQDNPNDPAVKEALAARQAKVEELKTAFLTRRLSLKPEESKNFWPVYNKHQKDMMDLKEEERAYLKDQRANMANLKEEQKEEFVDNYIGYNMKFAEIDNRYHLKYKSILPIDKVVELYKAEVDFKKEVLNRLKENDKSDHDVARRQEQGGERQAEREARSSDPERQAEMRKERQAEQKKEMQYGGGGSNVDLDGDDIPD